MKDDAERILSIDYGEKRIGIAISDPLKMFAIPLITIDNNNLFFTKLKEIIEQYNFVKVVLGYPLKEDGTKTILTDKVEEFKTKLEKQFKIEVIYVDERYSSSIAWEQIKVSVKSKKKRRDKSLIDKNAAAVILEDFLSTL
ncbi:MAG: Holliday junction resolvase RuvX [Ignavibacteriales bacterium]|nr:Holliday junction resolvase RuvX [Ignavibacteriota bacterium]MCB9249197.1 Holliday junction resolvase RuvX [Ignavibacteriales bacterium]